MTALADAISGILDAHQIGTGALYTDVPGLRLLRSRERMPPYHMEYRPSLCIVAQGGKQVFVGETTLTYGAMQSLVITVDLPVLGQICEASDDAPFIGATLELDMAVQTDVAMRLEPRPDGGAGPGLGLVVSDLDRQITASVGRLLDLIGQPQAIEILYPAIMREVSYWLLTGPAGATMRRMALPAGPQTRVARAIQRLREGYDTPVSVAELARIAGMSPSSFHQHFRSLTAMSPLQYQKHLRLLEARRRMVSDGDKAGVAAVAVGYESVSQFSREYARMFGAPPRREAQRARAGLTAAAL